MKKWFAGAALLLLMAFAFPAAVLAAGGRWIPGADGGWQYERPDGSTAKGTWEQVDGEWYHFGNDALMETGWQKIGNIRYDLTETGALAEGWRYCGENNGWYYFDLDGNAHIGWLYDNGYWYWFNPNGVMNTAEAREIGGVRYYFREDGRLRANEYRGFRYLDGNGRFDSAHDVTAQDYKGNGIRDVDSGVKEEIGEEISGLPKIWLQYFTENDWRFVYCPDKDYYSSARYGNGGRYYVRYKVNTYEKTVRFTSKDAVKQGFGEFVYYMARVNAESSGFIDEVKANSEEIRGFTELPEAFDRDYRVVFGVLFEKYLDEYDRQYMKNELEGIYQILEEVEKGKIYLR